MATSTYPDGDDHALHGHGKIWANIYSAVIRTPSRVPRYPLVAGSRKAGLQFGEEGKHGYNSMKEVISSLNTTAPSPAQPARRGTGIAQLWVEKTPKITRWGTQQSKKILLGWSGRRAANPESHLLVTLFRSRGEECR